MPNKVVSEAFTFPSKESLNTLLHSLNITFEHEHPVVFDGEALYIRRYFNFATELEHYIYDRNHPHSNNELDYGSTAENISGKIKSCLSALFPAQKDNLSTDSFPSATTESIDWQKIAVANAIDKPFCIIAGGPGTGKNLYSNQTTCSTFNAKYATK